MRLWHTKLIPVLPKEQLMGQWRELPAIAIVKKLKIAADCGLLILNVILLITKISILYINFLKKRKTC